MIHDCLRDRNLQEYADYLARMQAIASEAEADERAEYVKLNWQRSQRIQRTYEVPANLHERLQALAEPQWWVVLTEPWCGDSAQCLPYIAKFAEVNPQIHLKILLRDQNLDLMDRYLTSGKRGIPKLIAYDERGRELFTWGPRPKEAAALFDRNRKAGLSKAAIMEKLHLWYARDRGQAMEREFAQILDRLQVHPASLQGQAP